MSNTIRKNKPPLFNGNSLALDQLLAKESASKALKSIKKQKKQKCSMWLEDLNLKAKYEFHSRKQFELTVKRLVEDDKNKQFKTSHPGLLRSVRNGQSIIK